MKNVLALVVLVGGIILSAWLSLFVMFVPGIIEIIEQCQTGVVAAPLAWAIAKIVLARPVTVFCVGFCVSVATELTKE